VSGRSGRRPPAALLLDLDGTLVDSEQIHRAAFQTVFADRGWDLADVTVFTGRRAEDVFESEPGPWQGTDLAGLTADVLACVPTDALPVAHAGARALVESAVLHGVQVAVVTSAGHDWAERCLAQVLDVRRHVSAVVTSEQVVRGKPDPAGFALACSRLAVAAADCVAVEDSPAGVEAALGAGVGEVFGVSTTHPADRLTALGAVEVSADLLDLPARIGLVPGPG
jgi:sugar-phosphatase